MTGFDLDILAADDVGDTVPFIGVIVVMVVFSVVGSVIKKFKEKNAERERLRSGTETPEETRWDEPEEDLPVNSREAMARAALKSMGFNDEPLAPPVRAKRVRRQPKPAPAPAKAPLGPPIDPTVDDHVDEHISAGLPKAAARTTAPTKVAVNLSSREKLRQAVVLREILGQPKGLRRESALWDSA